MSGNEKPDPGAANGGPDTSPPDSGTNGDGTANGAVAANGDGHPANTTERIAALQRSGAEFAKEWVQTPAPAKDKRYLALRNFAISITIFNLVGFPLLGFEQPFLWPFVALATAYSVEIGLEVLAAWAYHRAPAFMGRGPRGMFEFLLPAHITGLAFNFLVFAHDRLWPVIFGVTVAVGAKWVLRAEINGRMRHFMNPSNFGIVVAILVFPMIAVAPPYHFVEYISGPADALIVIALLFSGTMLNAKLTGKMPLIFAWLAAFVLQAVVRGVFDPNTSTLAALSMMTGLAFVLFTNYMVTDPGTTPMGKKYQWMFGASVGLLYGVVTQLHISYGLFFALVLTCGARGAYWWGRGLVGWWRQRSVPLPEPAAPSFVEVAGQTVRTAPEKEAVRP
ncbi:enediyne biosynthesis protein [Nocardia brasiliensis]|uniref:enediyne biosynthesis protein n=1 Tax=Nocardia brasiliensis TaxID=37326 RepID=UPI002457CD00|nr:enediyne biosynthesis protein [Nocardia brasiliensis]